MVMVSCLCTCQVEVSKDLDLEQCSNSGGTERRQRQRGSNGVSTFVNTTTTTKSSQVDARELVDVHPVRRSSSTRSMKNEQTRQGISLIVLRDRIFLETTNKDGRGLRQRDNATCGFADFHGIGI